MRVAEVGSVASLASGGWDAVFVALAASLVGGALGAWITARHNRKEAWRDRQARAADSFMRRVTDSIVAIRDTFHPTFAAERVEELGDRVDSSHAMIARLELLFG